MSPKGCVEARSAVAFVVPDPSVERKLETFGATIGLNRPAMVAHRPSDRGCNAGQPRTSDDDHRVGASEAVVERPAIVSVGDPPIAGEQLRLPLTPLVSWTLDPSRLPEVAIQVNHRQIDPFAERASKRGFAGAARPNDRDTLHEFPVWLTLASSIVGYRAGRSCHGERNGRPVHHVALLLARDALRVAEPPPLRRDPRGVVLDDRRRGRSGDHNTPRRIVAGGVEFVAGRAGPAGRRCHNPISCIAYFNQSRPGTSGSEREAFAWWNTQ